jgi:hypothetical protein
MLEQTKVSTVSAMGVKVPLNALGDTVLALAIRTYVNPPESESPRVTEGHTDHHDHSDHSDCLCVLVGL